MIIETTEVIMETTQVMNQIEKLIKTNSSVAQKIEKQIVELEREFNERVNDGDYDTLADMCGIENDELYYGADIDRYKLFSLFLDNSMGEPYLDEVEDFINEVDGYEQDRRQVSRKLRDLKELLD